MSAADKQKEFDELLARHVRRAVREDEGGACPEANLLAAYQEHALSAEEAAACKEHFAGCARCREILAALEDSEGIPAEEPARVAAPAPGAGEAKRAGRPMWWMAPAGVLAAAMMLWIVTRVEKRAVRTGTADVQVAENRPQAPPVPGAAVPPAAPAEQRAADRLDVTRGPAAARTGAKSLDKDAGVVGFISGNAAEPPAPQENEIVAAKKKTGGLEKSAAGEVGGKSETFADAGAIRSRRGEKSVAKPDAAGAGETLGLVSSAAAPAAAAPVAKQQEKYAVANDENQVQLKEEAAARAVAVQREKVARDDVGQRTTALEQKMLPAMTLITAPGGRVQWSAGPMGRIERSTDGGRSWELQSSGVRVELLAGDSTGEEVCWVVGRQGTILLTTDGRNWRKISAPAAVNFVGVTASDERKATIWGAGSGERYSTEDGGAHWTPEAAVSH
ncbi:MAG: zf-HC2 domain-containing protein [Acidobacteriia bacterium]|nr:zf-HC2 domain-containing protein [Terriglobia bacterium]